MSLNEKELNTRKEESVWLKRKLQSNSSHLASLSRERMDRPQTLTKIHLNSLFVQCERRWNAKTILHIGWFGCNDEPYQLHTHLQPFQCNICKYYLAKVVIQVRSNARFNVVLHIHAHMHARLVWWTQCLSTFNQNQNQKKNNQVQNNR